jgi:hypothetical protein
VLPPEFLDALDFRRPVDHDKIRAAVREHFKRMGKNPPRTIRDAEVEEFAKSYIADNVAFRVDDDDGWVRTAGFERDHGFPLIAMNAFMSLVSPRNRWRIPHDCSIFARYGIPHAAP